MFHTMKTGVENGRKYDDMLKQLIIIAPTKDQHGDNRKYSYLESKEMAEIQGLLKGGDFNNTAMREKNPNYQQYRR